MDNRTVEQRHKNMSSVRTKGTGPELTVRRTLHSLGFRFRLHPKTLPGTPDIVLTRYRAVILVHGCFWHGHGCPRAKLPQTRSEFWANKISANQSRDAIVIASLHRLSWRVCVIWSCALTGRLRQTPASIGTNLANWLQEGANFHEIAGGALL